MGTPTTTAYLRQFACVLPSSACCVKKKNVYLRFQIFVSNVQTFPSGFNPGGGGEWNMKGVGMLVGNSELDP